MFFINRLLFLLIKVGILDKKLPIEHELADNPARSQSEYSR